MAHGATCQVSLTRRVMELQWTIGFIKNKKAICFACKEKPWDLAFDSICRREWHCTCSNPVMKTPGLPDLFVLKEQV